jgi:hypothetical protein
VGEGCVRFQTSLGSNARAQPLHLIAFSLTFNLDPTLLWIDPSKVQASVVRPKPWSSHQVFDSMLHLSLPMDHAVSPLAIHASHQSYCVPRISRPLQPSVRLSSKTILLRFPCKTVRSISSMNYLVSYALSFSVLCAAIMEIHFLLSSQTVSKNFRYYKMFLTRSHFQRLGPTYCLHLVLCAPVPHIRFLLTSHTVQF